MKNCLIVLVVLVVCAVIAGWLTLEQPSFLLGNSAPTSYIIATWTDFDDPHIRGLEVQVGTDRIIIEVPAEPQFKSITEKGHWNLHAFYVDSHVDSPAEVMVAQELKNEDLEVNLGRFLPSHPGKIVCVKTSRQSDDRPPYPVYDPKVRVTYPPPKGLIRVGMLECDLESLPWRPDKVEVQDNGESDAPPPRSAGNGRIFADLDPNPGDSGESGHLYTYHCDRADAFPLLVTVYHGRVTEVTGGAEETSDIPYQLPPPTPSAAQMPPANQPRSWGQWLFDSVFTK